MTRKTLTGSSIATPPFAAAPGIVAGDWVFLGGAMATDWKTGVVVADGTPPDFGLFRDETGLQTHEIFQQFEKLLSMAGTNLDNLVEVNQFLPDWNQFRNYIPVRNEYLTHDRPGSTAIAVDALLVPGSELIVNGMAVVPHDGIVKEAINNPAAPVPRAGYSLVNRYGDWIWSAGASPTDFQSRAAYPGAVGHTQPDGVWVDPNFWYGSTIENQAEFDLHKLSLYLEAADSDLEHVVKAQVFLTDTRELPGLMRVWKRTWGDHPPATTIVPVDRMGIGGSHVEINVIALTSSSNIEVQRIEDREAQPGFDLPHAIKAGPYVFLSGQMAVDANGIDAGVRRTGASPYLLSPGRDETRVILENVDRVCRAVGGSVRDVVRAELFCTDLSSIGSGIDPWNDAFRESPPTVSVMGVTGPHVVPSLTIAGDFIAYIP